jgi:hypothetical protein
MVVNSGAASITIDYIKVIMDTCEFDLWTHGVSVPIGGQRIVTQTASGADDGCTNNGHMDTSDIGPGGVGWAGRCDVSGVVPQVEVSINGTVETLTDAGLILNTGGVDAADCGRGAELTQWSLIGGEPCGPAVLTLAPPTQTHDLGQTATVTATYVNGCGQPLPGVLIDFNVIAGPNTGGNGSGTTDANGNATFSYTSTLYGTDTVQASQTNAFEEVLYSNNVAVVWADRTAPTASCVETTNPSGKNVPTSGPNAGKSGQNPDGFYQLLASDNVGIASIVIADGGSSFVSQPFASGDKVKITQAPGATPSDSRPGPGVIVSQLKLKGDAYLVVTDTSGNATRVACRVPPPPK